MPNKRQHVAALLNAFSGKIRNSPLFGSFPSHSTSSRTVSDRFNYVLQLSLPLSIALQCLPHYCRANICRDKSNSVGKSTGALPVTHRYRKSEKDVAALALILKTEKIEYCYETCQRNVNRKIL